MLSAVLGTRAVSGGVYIWGAQVLGDGSLEVGQAGLSFQGIDVGCDRA
jgi:hypothetical protein